MQEDLDRLAAFPSFLVDALDRLGDPRARERPDEESWSLTEQLWHLADLEREAWLVRIERLLAEDQPALADFDGDAIAKQRDYRAKDPYLALQRFRAARSASLARMRGMNALQWKRTGTLEGVGPITIADLPRRMSEHDEAHRLEIEALLARPGRAPGSAL